MAKPPKPKPPVEKPKTGRPQAPIEVEQVKKLAERGWSSRQIAAHFDVDIATICRRFSAIIEESRQHGAAKLIDVLWQRGVTEKDSRVLLNLADRIIGPVTKKIEITKEQALEVIEEEIKSRGLETYLRSEGNEGE